MTARDRQLEGAKNKIVILVSGMGPRITRTAKNKLKLLVWAGFQTQKNKKQKTDLRAGRWSIGSGLRFGNDSRWFQVHSSDGDPIQAQNDFPSDLKNKVLQVVRAMAGTCVVHSTRSPIKYSLCLAHKSNSTGLSSLLRTTLAA